MVRGRGGVALVNTEWLMAVHEDIFVLPCGLDATPLPQCLRNTVRLKLGDPRSWADTLARAVRTAPEKANELAPVIRAEERTLKETVATLNQCQMTILEQLGKRRLDEARQLQALADEALRHAEAVWARTPRSPISAAMTERTPTF